MKTFSFVYWNSQIQVLLLFVFPRKIKALNCSPTGTVRTYIRFISILFLLPRFYSYIVLILFYRVIFYVRNFSFTQRSTSKVFRKRIVKNRTFTYFNIRS